MLFANFVHFFRKRLIIFHALKPSQFQKRLAVSLAMWRRLLAVPPQSLLKTDATCGIKQGPLDLISSGILVARPIQNTF
ncbi:uncharacterized protein BDW70DRAFT_144431, partial [Aspergillus foveolatus]|uniref:uncharacterized protein n=1 Tax=Aspergillus foveolatus TaxID=210207 RepID=UPI003CCCA7C3